MLNAKVHAVETIIINEDQSDDIRHRYTQELLIAALDRTIVTHGPYELIGSIKEGIHATIFMMNKKGFGDIVQGVTRPEWEQKLIPIRTPILKGLLGLRVIVMNKGMQSTFNTVNSIDDLKKLSLGTGKKWSVTKIFDHYNFNIMQIVNTKSLYSMLKKNRFDYMSRGVSEILIEYNVQVEENINLTIEKNILLNIPLPVYFFVNPNKPKLAARIEQGLTLLIKDGTLDRIFLRHFGAAIKQLNLPERTIFHLDNPSLTDAHPLEDPLSLLELLRTNPTNSTQHETQ